MRAIVLFVCLLLSSGPVGGLDPPFLSGPIVDLAGMVPDDVQARLDRRLRDFQEQQGPQVVVLTLLSLEGEALDEFSVRVASEWALGREGIDDGVLFLIAQGDRKMRIEVGYGLEGQLTDAHSRRVLDWVVTPRFQAGDFGGGIEAGVEAILGQIDGTARPLEAPTRSSGNDGIPIGLVIMIFILLILFLRSRRRRNGWSSDDGWIFFPPTSGRGGGFGGGFGGGGFGGGGFGGGGGGFGGGGASGGW